jgi:hypothetical protein
MRISIMKPSGDVKKVPSKGGRRENGTQEDDGELWSSTPM